MEPEVVDLANFLVAMGARIDGIGGDTMRVDGVEALHGVEYTIIADRIVTGTLLLAGAVTRGDVTVTFLGPTGASFDEKLFVASPANTFRSRWLRQAAFTRSSAWPGPQVGVGFSTRLRDASPC